MHLPSVALVCSKGHCAIYILVWTPLSPPSPPTTTPPISRSPPNNSFLLLRNYGTDLQNNPSTQLFVFFLILVKGTFSTFLDDLKAAGYFISVIFFCLSFRTNRGGGILYLTLLPKYWKSTLCTSLIITQILVSISKKWGSLIFACRSTPDSTYHPLVLNKYEPGVSITHMSGH